MRRATAIASIVSAACLLAPAAQAADDVELPAAGTQVSAWADTCVNTSVKWDFSPPLPLTEVLRSGTATVNYQASWTCGFGGAAANVDPRFPGLNPGAGLRTWGPSNFVIPDGSTYLYRGNCAAAALSGGATGAVGTVVDGTTFKLVHRDPHANAGVLSETAFGGTHECLQSGIGISTVTGPSASWSPIPTSAARGD